ncbi:transposable element Tcb1 transposase [Trichonephila clavipes]|nr:transposable element Tcb1 transposase [Trichonephila clavipes]
MFVQTSIPNNSEDFEARSSDLPPSGSLVTPLFEPTTRQKQLQQQHSYGTKEHLDDFLRGRTIVRLEVDVPSWKYPRNLESPRVSSPGFGNGSKMIVIRSTASGLSRQLSSATGTAVLRQTVYRRLGHIGLYARRPVRCVPLTATHCRLRLS